MKGKNKKSTQHHNKICSRPKTTIILSPTVTMAALLDDCSKKCKYGIYIALLSWSSKRFTTLCGGLCQTAYLGANCSHAVHNLIKENSSVHRCPQNRVSGKPSHRGQRPLLLIRPTFELRTLISWKLTCWPPIFFTLVSLSFENETTWSFKRNFYEADFL